jgi:very-short-patch-repair endonuclease
VLTGPKKTIQRARKQRQEMSLPEVLLWEVLRGSPEGIRFRRLHPSGQLVSDFFCHTAGLVIEVDGESHNRGDQPEFDERRDVWLQSNGLTVLRIPAREVLNNFDGVFRCILAKAHELKSARDATPRPIPPLKGEVARSDGGVSLVPNETRNPAPPPETATPLRPRKPATSPLRRGSSLEHRP